ncbi:MAG: nicotinate (nicotinamide) nucleotide adenylyltransferase [Candidatus Izemoplasmatales bacterium]|nr:nicotinate (nicotinamide) nucleotide adenylyltransferase [Candidatus Izemoplasmatales bacterium]
MVVIFGGAFNPPTLAHKVICEHIFKSIPVNEFIYLPVSNLYTKRSLLSNYHRLQMLKLMTHNMKNVEVSSMEFDDSDYLGTYQTLLRFQEKYPCDEIAFVIGADNLEKLPKWINARSLLSEFRFIVINRQNIDIDSYIENHPFLHEFYANFIILPHFNMDMSSTTFRTTFDPSYVSKEVYDYIIQNQLYRG